MHFKLPTIALAASILASGVLAIPHGHMHMHMRPHEAKRALVTKDVYVTRTQTDWVTIIWDGTSYITPVATPVNAAQTAVGGAEVHVATDLQAPAAVVTQPPAPVATQTTFATVVAQNTPVAPVVPAPVVAVDSVPSTGDNVAGAVPNAGDIVASVVSSVIAPIIPTPEAPVIPIPTPVVVVPPTTGGDGSTGSGKRGVAYNNANLVSDFLGSDSKISWAYNWGSNTPTIPSTVEYVPMIWGTGADHSTGWNAAASAAIAAGSKHLLAFNEPDFASQSNLDPGAAAAGYRQFVQPFAGKAKLGAPAVTNGPAPMGLAYLKAFFAACADCTIDFVPIHWYDAASNIAGFKKHVADMRDVAAGRPLWITEFQATGSVEEQDAFLREVLPWLDGTDYVERYAYFYADGVLTQNNVISTLGNTFKTFSS